MDCKAFGETLDLYVDNELAPAVARAAHLHEQECSSCKKTTDLLLNLRRQMKLSVAQYEPPRDLVRAVRRIPESRWKRFSEHFDLRDLGGNTSWRAFSVGRRNIPVTLGVAVLLLISAFVVYEANYLGQVMRLRSHNPMSTSLIDSRESERRLKNLEPKRKQTWVTLENISTNLQRAVIAAEDPNFTTHRGFDYQAIQEAWGQERWGAQEEAKQEGESGWDPQMSELKKGGPTISQQLAKNLFLSRQRTVLRKSQEAIITIFLERTLTKRRILELYLNVIEWGDGIYGAEAAAQHYFHKAAEALMPDEAAFLAAMVPNPRTLLNPELNPQRVAWRQRIILRDMPRVEIP